MHHLRKSRVLKKIREDGVAYSIKLNLVDPRIAEIATQKLKLPPLMNKQIARYNGYNGRRDAVGGAPGDEANTPFSSKLYAGPR